MAGKVSYGASRDGLIRYYDAANSSSYTSGSSFARDLSREGVNMILINSPDYVTDFGGAIAFKSASVAQGGSDAFSIPYFPLDSSSFAVDLWVTLVPTSSYLQGLVSCGDIWSNTDASRLGWCIGYGGGPGSLSFGMVFATAPVSGTIANARSGVNVTNFNIPHNIFMHKNNTTNRFSIYYDGGLVYDIPIGATATLRTGSFTNRTTITSNIWVHAPSWPTGSIHSLKIWNGRDFTRGEIVHNYLEIKNRYGQ